MPQAEARREPSMAGRAGAPVAALVGWLEAAAADGPSKQIGVNGVDCKEGMREGTALIGDTKEH